MVLPLPNRKPSAPNAHPTAPEATAVGVVVSEPGASKPVIASQPGVPGQWSSGICDCCVDGCDTCCTVCCCAPCVFATHAEVVGKDGCTNGLCFCILYAPSYLTYLLIGLPFIPLSCCIHAPIRRQLRERYGIAEGCLCEDCICTTFCTPCSLCQEEHEIRVHGEARGH